MTQTATRPAPAPDAPAGHRVQRAVRTYSFGFAALLTVALLITNLTTVHGGFDLSISPLITLTNAVFVVYLYPHGFGGALAVPIMLGLGLLVGARGSASSPTSSTPRRRRPPPTWRSTRSSATWPRCGPTWTPPG